MLTEELLTFLFDGQRHILSQPMENWLTDSRRFTSFVNTFRDKIRKKIRVTQDPESLLDLRLELETAYLLHREPRLHLIYEPGMAEKARAADFAVTFTTSVTFMLEVTRLRTEQKPMQTETPDAAGTISSTTDRVVDAVCSKLGQLKPQQSNVILIGVERLKLSQDDLRTAMLRLQQRVERDNPAFLQRYRFRDRADFFRHFQRLSEILVRDINTNTAQWLVVWSNPQARYPLSSKVQTALHRSHTL
jgi:hypothetical protein